LKAKIIGLTIIIVVITSITLAIAFVGPIDISTPKKEDEFKNWNRSGPFAINKFEYRVGDNIFLAVNGLTPNDIGSATFVLPNGTTKYISIPFDGTQKSGFNQYFKPSISKARSICTINDIVGEWTIIFQGTEYDPLKFRILNETIPSEIGNFQQVC
jgi:hypothetical protein